MALSESDVLKLYGRTGLTAPASLSSKPSAKYRSTKKQVDGHLFDSAGEAEAYRYLRNLETAGCISCLELQPVYILQERFEGFGFKLRAIMYRGDFRYRDLAGKTVVVDYKGFRTEAYKLKRKMFLALYPEVLFMEWNRQLVKELTR